LLALADGIAVAEAAADAPSAALGRPAPVAPAPRSADLSALLPLLERRLQTCSRIELPRHLVAHADLVLTYKGKLGRMRDAPRWEESLPTRYITCGTGGFGAFHACSVAFRAPDQLLVATGGPSILVFSVDGGLLGRLPTDHPCPADIAVLRDGSLWITSRQAALRRNCALVMCRSTDNQECTMPFRAVAAAVLHSGEVVTVDAAPDGDLSIPYGVSVRDPTTGGVLRSFGEHPLRLPCSRTAITATCDGFVAVSVHPVGRAEVGIVHMFDPQTGRCCRTLHMQSPQNASGYYLASGPGGVLAAVEVCFSWPSTSMSAGISIWTTDGQRVCRLPGPSRGPHGCGRFSPGGLAFLPDGRLVVLNAEDELLFYGT
jgi:hypothetical protein